MPFKFIARPGSHLYQRCGEVPIYDITGAYDPAYNETGWGDGTTNPLITAVTGVEAKLIFADGSFWTGSIFSGTLPFPNLNMIPYVVTEAMIGQRPPDGKVTLEAEVYGTNIVGDVGSLGKSVESFFLTCNVACCVRNLQKLALAGKDSCDDSAWKLWDKANTLLLGLRDAADCGQFEYAQTILERLEELCASNNADCGC